MVQLKLKCLRRTYTRAGLSNDQNLILTDNGDFHLVFNKRIHTNRGKARQERAFCPADKGTKHKHNARPSKWCSNGEMIG